jgi:hypothetical protein
LLDILVQAGLPRLIDWRCGFGPGQTRHTLEQRRIQQALDRHLNVLDPDDRQAIEGMFYHLLAAMNEAQVALPLAMLLNEYPSSHRRRRRGRRFWFGRPAILHRHAASRRPACHKVSSWHVASKSGSPRAARPRQSLP